jgi:hypothetical protein
VLDVPRAIPVFTQGPLHVDPRKSFSTVECLKHLHVAKGSRNVLKRLDYNKVNTQEVEYLLLTFNYDIVIELPPLENQGNHKESSCKDENHYIPYQE